MAPAWLSPSDCVSSLEASLYPTDVQAETQIKGDLLVVELGPEKELELCLLNLSQRSRMYSQSSPLRGRGVSLQARAFLGLAGLTPNSKLSLCFSVKEGYKVRSDVNITLEFRTSSENGVLLGISSAKVDAIGLEIVSGKVGVQSP